MKDIPYTCCFCGHSYMRGDGKPCPRCGQLNPTWLDLLLIAAFATVLTGPVIIALWGFGII